MKIKAVAFDMDGLIFDTEDTYFKTGEILLARRGEVYTKELDAECLGRLPRVCFELYKSKFGFPESWQELEIESNNIFIELLDEGFSTMPGLLELLDHLEQRNIPKGICTSSSRRIATEVLQRKDLMKRFDFVFTSNDVTRGKPDPEFYLKAAERFGIDPAEMLVLEDSPAGCQAGASAGAFVIAVLATHNAHYTFPAADKVVNALNDPQVIELF